MAVPLVWYNNVRREVRPSHQSQNQAARACYLKGGFEDHGEQYLGGPAGPQHIMRGKIA